eukprot:m.223949 g.223949  ORF g.223949 m.223949 type:complete len:61 (-) comp13852_c2_seq5:15-197(-)
MMRCWHVHSNSMQQRSVLVKMPCVFVNSTLNGQIRDNKTTTKITHTHVHTYTYTKMHNLI